MTRRWTRSASSAALVALALSLFAAPSPAQKGRKPDPEETRARQLFKEGQTAYDVGEFARALERYTEAYKVKALPGFLFNVAQCHRQLGNFKEAAFFFGRFIDNTSPKAPNIELARELLEDMKKKNAAKEAEEARLAEEKRRADEAKKAADAPLARKLAPDGTPLLPPPPPPPVEETPLYKKGWFWGVIAGGVAVVAGSVAAGVAASQPREVTYTPSAGTLDQIDGRR